MQPTRTSIKKNKRYGTDDEAFEFGQTLKFWCVKLIHSHHLLFDRWIDK